jgi:Bacterial capsule synthesis protein PGA_cap
MRAPRLSGTICHVPRLALLAVVVLAVVSPAATGAESPTITISATGDIAMAPSGDGASGFFDAGIRKVLRAHITLGNLEGTLATGGSSKCGPGSSDCFAFRAPPSYSTALKQAGFTIMNLANNHALDYGESGQAETIAALKRAGLRFTGRPGEIAVLRHGGTKVAFVGFAPYPWAQSLLDIEDAVRLVRKAGRKADIVVVTMHAGAEGSDQQHVRPGPEWFVGEPRGNVYAFSHAVVRAGADLVVGHGPHVLRGIEWYRGRMIAYSLGNFLGNGTLNVSGVTGQTAVLHATLRRDGSWLEGKLVPVQLTSGGLPRVDSNRAALSTVRQLSRADFGRNAVRISPSGTLLPPAWRTG